jgi:putative phosphoribosyl transferase
VKDLRKEADDVVCLETPEHLFAIGLYYRDFHQITDDEVIRLLLIGRPEVERPAVPAPPAKVVAPIPPEKAIVPRPPAKVTKPVARKPARVKKRKRGKAPARRRSSNKSVRPS